MRNELDGDEHTGALDSQDEMGTVSRAAEQISGLQSDRKPVQMKRERMLGFTSLTWIAVTIWSDLIRSSFSEPTGLVFSEGVWTPKAVTLLTPAGLVGYFVPNKLIDSVLFKTHVSPAEPPSTLMDQTKWVELQGAKHESHPVTVNETDPFMSRSRNVKIQVKPAVRIMGKKHLRAVVCGEIDSYWALWEGIRPLIQEMRPLRKHQSTWWNPRRCYRPTSPV